MREYWKTVNVISAAGAVVGEAVKSSEKNK
jgi:hypothetical protein